MILITLREGTAGIIKIWYIQHIPGEILVKLSTITALLRPLLSMHRSKITNVEVNKDLQGYRKEYSGGTLLNYQ